MLFQDGEATFAGSDEKGAEVNYPSFDILQNLQVQR